MRIRKKRCKKMSEWEFKIEDFLETVDKNGFPESMRHLATLAVLCANTRLKEQREKMPVVYGFGSKDEDTGAWTYYEDDFDTHRARLMDIEELPRG